MCGSRVDARGPRGRARLHRHQPTSWPTNFNAPAVDHAGAAALYVFRTLVDDDIPLNDGCLKPIDI